MKIIKGNSVYVQLQDLQKILDLDFDIEQELKKEFKRATEGMNDYSRFSFIEYDDKSTVLYLKNQDWIIDYGVYFKLSIEDIDLINDKVLEEIEGLISLLLKYDNELYNNPLKEEEILAKMMEIDIQKKQKEYMHESLKFLIDIKFGLYTLDVQNGIVVK